jgi:WhiB family redox-sensing transcriptional regulator
MPSGVMMSLAGPQDNWRQRGACQLADPELFFPLSTARGSQPQIMAAKKICARCQVRGACLDFALSTGQANGIWGGTTEEERGKLRRRQLRNGSRPADRGGPEMPDAS